MKTPKEVPQEVPGEVPRKYLLPAQGRKPKSHQWTQRQSSRRSRRLFLRASKILQGRLHVKKSVWQSASLEPILVKKQRMWESFGWTRPKELRESDKVFRP